MKEVEAVKNESELSTVSVLLAKRHGEQMADIWSFGVNVALRISDLLKIRFTDIKGDRLIVQEGKTDKEANIQLNSKALEIVNLVRSRDTNSVFLFQSKRSRNITNKPAKPITRQAVSAAFKDVGETLGIALGTHSMRKTRGYHLYKKTNDIARVMKMLRHSSEAITLRYIGITQDDIDNDFNELIL